MKQHPVKDQPQDFHFQQTIEALTKVCPKRTQSNWRENNSQQDPQNLEYQLSEVAKIRVSHEKIFRKIGSKAISNIEDYEAFLTDEQPLESFVPNSDFYLTTTQDESRLNSSFSSIKQSQEDKEESEVQQIIQEKSVSYDQNQSFENEKTQKKSNDSSDEECEQEEAESTSVLFIPFLKDQAQCLADKQVEEHLMKIYTPLQYHQIFPWMKEEIKKIQDPIIRLHQQIIEFYKYIKPSRREKETRLDILEHIKSVILGIYPNAQVQAFGSYACELYLPDGDIDIVALINHETLNREKTLELYAKIYDEFKKHQKSTYKEIRFIRNAKIPLVKMVHKETNFSIDISLNVCTGLEQIKNIKSMIRQFPEFKYLILVLKMMLKIRNLNETFSGGIGSFLLVCMLYHYLRDFHFTSEPCQEKLYSLADYLLGFFSFYFMRGDYQQKIINVRTGATTGRKRRQGTLSMLNPFDDTTDIGKKAIKMDQVLEVFKNRHRVLKEKQYHLGESLLKQIVNPSMREFEYYQQKLKFQTQQGDDPEEQEPAYEQEKQSKQVMSEQFRRQQENYLRTIMPENVKNELKNRKIHRVNRAGYSKRKKGECNECENYGKEENSSLSY